MLQKDRADEAREILEGLETSEDLTPEDSESGNDEQKKHGFFRLFNLSGLFGFYNNRGSKISNWGRTS